MTYKKVNICMLGCSLDNNNRGVTALAFSALHLFERLLPDCDLNINYIVPGNSNNEKKYSVNDRDIQTYKINYKLKPTASNNTNLFWLTLLSLFSRLIILPELRIKILLKSKFLATIINSDLVCDIYGGDSFSDIYGLSKFLKGALLRLLVISIGKKITFLPQKYGPFYSNLSKLIAKELFKGSNTILSRDTSSIELLYELLGNNIQKDKIKYCPDIAFILPIEEVRNNFFDDFVNHISNPRIIGINVSGLLFYSGENSANNIKLKANYIEVVIGIINGLLDLKSVRIVFIPHVFDYYNHDVKLENDYSASVEVLNKLPLETQKKVFVLNEDYNQSQLKYIIGKCDCFLGSRMHACIAALSQSIPTIGLAYSKKFIGVFSSIGFKHSVVDMSDESTESAIRKSLMMVNESDEMLNIRILELQNNILTTFKQTVVSKFL